MPGKRELFTPREKLILDRVLERQYVSTAAWEAISDGSDPHAITSREIDALRRKIAAL